MEDSIRHCAEALDQWMKKHAPHAMEEQAHLDEESDARVYWNYGYLMALRDVLEAMDHHAPLPPIN